jgi:hypothetical protein
MCEIVASGLLDESEAIKYNLALNPSEFDLKLLNELIRCRENEDKNSANAFNWAVYGLGEKAERPNRIFKWNPITLTEYQELDAPIYIGCDWGKVDPWAIVEVKYYDGCLYVHERNYFSENQIREKLTTTEQAQINGEEEGIVSWMFNKLNIDKSCPVVADTNRPMKLAMLRRMGWDVHGANKIKNSIIDGIDLLHNLRVFFTSVSENIDHEQENYSYKVDHHGTVLETPEDLDNHSIDAIRYVALHLQRESKIKLI